MLENEKLKYEFDFDIAWDAFESPDGKAIFPVEYELRKLAKKHGVVIERINYYGPGGGNPNVFVAAPDRTTARAFLTEAYEYKTEQDIHDYVDPCLPEE